MKYWRGYLVAAIFAACTWGLVQFAQSHWELVDMVYPYVTRMIQNFLANWSSGVEFCLWQLIVIVLGVLLLALEATDKAYKKARQSVLFCIFSIISSQPLDKHRLL